MNRVSKAELERALEAVEPASNAARIREVMPVLERKLAAGVRLVDLLQALRQAGLALTETFLRTYIYRHRKACAQPARQSAPFRQPAQRAAEVAAPEVPVRPPATSTGTSAPTHGLEADESVAAFTQVLAPEPPKGLGELEVHRLLRPDQEQRHAEFARLKREAERAREEERRQRQRRPPAA